MAIASTFFIDTITKKCEYDKYLALSTLNYCTPSVLVKEVVLDKI